MSADESRTVLFICRHGAAKSVLAAADLRKLAAEHRIRIVGEAAGVEPPEQVSPAVIQALARDGVDVGQFRPRRVTQSALASAWRVITFSLDPTDLPTKQVDERWDDVPAVSEDLHAARAAIRRHLERLVQSLDRHDTRDHEDRGEQRDRHEP
jgi:protein-tyrosine-phosphatase